MTVSDLLEVLEHLPFSQERRCLHGIGFAVIC
jgi:hypothetical protein